MLSFVHVFAKAFLLIWLHGQAAHGLRINPEGIQPLHSDTTERCVLGINVFPTFKSSAELQRDATWYSYLKELYGSSVHKDNFYPIDVSKFRCKFDPIDVPIHEDKKIIELALGRFGATSGRIHVSMSILRSLEHSTEGYGVLGLWIVVLVFLYIAAYFSERGMAQTKTTQLQNNLPPKEFLMIIGIIATALQGGGCIFGFSSFADVLLKMSGSPYTVQTVPAIFVVGHQITAFGCIVSGPLLNLIGPRRHAMIGLLMEAFGLVSLAFSATLPMVWSMLAYGLVGWGGCHVLMAALTLTPAFENANVLTATLTVAFQAGGFVFIVLPFVNWEKFFIAYGLACVAVAAVFGFTFPDEPLPAYISDEESEDNTTMKDILLRPHMIAFLIAFMVAGNALIYGIGEFSSALNSKDSCHINGSMESCDHQELQDYLNDIVKPILGNLILPSSLFCGYLIDKYGFCIPAVVKVLSVQIFLATLWLLDLQSQIVTIGVYNIANSFVFTVQNAYICSVNPKHIGNLFAVSNLALGIGNILVDWFSFNPFDSGNGVGTSLQIICIVWILALFPLYSWGFYLERYRDDQTEKMQYSMIK